MFEAIFDWLTERLVLIFIIFFGLAAIVLVISTIVEASGKAKENPECSISINGSLYQKFETEVGGHRYAVIGKYSGGVAIAHQPDCEKCTHKVEKDERH